MPTMRCIWEYSVFIETEPGELRERGRSSEFRIRRVTLDEMRAALATPGDLVVLLSEVRSMANYYYPIWPDYEDPLFALWPDGRVMVRESGGYAGPALFIESALDQTEVNEIRSWIEEAALDDLAASYPLPRRSGDLMIFDLPQWRLQVRDGDVKR